MKKYFLNIILFSAVISSCTNEIALDGLSVSMDVYLDSEQKITLNNADAGLKSGRIWRWEQGDVLTYYYKQGDVEKEIRSTITEIDPKNSSLIHVTISAVPEDAAFTRVVVGNDSVFGKTCIGGSSIPASLVYATNVINSKPGETNIPGVTLDHQCSYFLIFPDMVKVGESSSQIKAVEVKGHALTGKDEEETIIVSLYDEASRSCQSRWLALSCRATDIVFTADYGSGKAEMATVVSAGSGKCKLFEISNKHIGEEYK